MSDQTCSYYELLESFSQCGPKGYAQSYGGKYCKEFLDNRDRFENKKWQDNVRKCLQGKMSDALEQKYKEQGGFKCLEIKEFGFDSHVPCYMDPGEGETFCNLSLGDHAKIFAIAYDDLLEAVPTGCIVYGKCIMGKIFTDKICTKVFKKIIDFSLNIKNTSFELLEKVNIFQFQGLQEQEVNLKIHLNSNVSAIIRKKPESGQLKEDYADKFISFSGTKEKVSMKLFQEKEGSYDVYFTEEIKDPLKL